jgi:aflatoxin B1 aldehyde reductase
MGINKVIVGASSVRHLEDNLVDLVKRALPEEAAEALEKAWSVAKGAVPKYWH